MPADTGNKRAVRILLECILVGRSFWVAPKLSTRGSLECRVVPQLSLLFVPSETIRTVIIITNTLFFNRHNCYYKYLVFELKVLNSPVLNIYTTHNRFWKH